MSDLNLPGQFNKVKLPLATKISIFLAVFFISFLAVSAFNGVIHNIDMSERSRILTVSAVQSILVFIFPAVVAACLEFSKPAKVLTLNVKPGALNILAVIICFIIGMCFLNQLIYWNDGMSLPPSMAELEKTLRTWEENSREFSNIVLSDKSVSGLISGVLIVGCITGLAEELFFRDGLQRLLMQGMSKHWAIWITAFLFSAMHFQFYGFIPRLLLGAFFGYLFLWSGSIWTSVFAHALNNSIVVASSWLIARGIVHEDIEMLGICESGIPWLPIASGLLLILFIKYFKGWFCKIPSK